LLKVSSGRQVETHEIESEPVVKFYKAAIVSHPQGDVLIETAIACA